MNLEAKPYGIKDIKANYDKLLQNCLGIKFNCFDCPLKDYTNCQGILANAIIEKIREDEITIKRQEHRIKELYVMQDDYIKLYHSIEAIKEIIGE